MQLSFRTDSIFLNISLIVIGWILIYIGHDFIVPNAKKPIFIALSDPSVHALVAIMLILPFYLYGLINIKIAIIAVSLAIFIDIDHAIAAGSIDIKAMLSLSSRPISHSILFSVIIGSIFAFIFSDNNNTVYFLAYLFIVSLISHVMRDAIESDMTPWAFPLKSMPISKIIFFIGFMSLNFLHLVYSIKIK
jgi:hypothetical protein